MSEWGRKIPIRHGIHQCQAIITNKRREREKHMPKTASGNRQVEIKLLDEDHVWPAFARIRSAKLLDAIEMRALERALLGEIRAPKDHVPESGWRKVTAKWFSLCKRFMGNAPRPTAAEWGALKQLHKRLGGDPVETCRVLDGFFTWRTTCEWSDKIEASPMAVAKHLTRVLEFLQARRPVKTSEQPPVATCGVSRRVDPEDIKAFTRRLRGES